MSEAISHHRFDCAAVSLLRDVVTARECDVVSLLGDVGTAGDEQCELKLLSWEMLDCRVSIHAIGCLC